MASPLTHLKPSHDEIVALALREADPRQVERFEPIARGPAWAIASLACIGLLALPASLVRLLRASWHVWRER